MRKIRRLLVSLTLASVTLVMGQNCGGGFESRQMSLSSMNGGFDISPLGAPVIEFDPKSVSENTNSKNITIPFGVLFDRRAIAKTVSCQLDSLPAEDCSSGHFMLTGLSDGDHTVKINAEDNKGQKATQKVILFRVDTAVPSISVSESPASVISSSSVSIAFTASDSLSGVASIQCAHNTASFSACQSPVTLGNLAQGAHSFKIKAFDKAGNPSTEAILNWTVNSSAASVSISSKPNAITSLKNASFSFSGTAGGMALVSYECAHNGAAFAACTSPASLSNLADRSHSFSVRGKSAAGITSAAVTYNWTVDSVAPATPVLSANVSALTMLKAATISFSATDAGSQVKEFQCSLDNAAFSVCTSPRALTALAEGAHSLRVKAIDNASNESAVGSFSWNVDSLAPTLTFTKTPAAATTETSTQFTFNSSDAGSGLNTVQCSLDAGSFAGCTSPQNLSNLSSGTHSFAVKATDKAGNTTTITHSWMIESLVLDGVALYGAKCAHCHNPLATSTKFNRTQVQIADAISTLPQMKNDPALVALTSNQLQAIANALVKSTGGGGGTDTTPLGQCTPSDVRGRSKEGVRRLSRKELQASFTHALGDLAGDINTALQNYPEQDIVEAVEKYDPLFSSAQAVNIAEVVDTLAGLVVSRNLFGRIDSCLNNASINEACWKSVYTNFGKKVFRRPLTTDEVNKLAAATLTAGNKNDAVYAMMHMLFRSPAFMFHLEFGVTEESTRVRLSDHEVANRISFAIIGGPPDDTLMSAADQGQLKTVAQVEAHVSRLLDSAKARAKMEIFFSEWLQLSHIQPPQNEYMGWYHDLGTNGDMDKIMRKEIQDYLFYIFWKKKGTFNELMTAKLAFPRFQGWYYGGSGQPPPMSALAHVYGGDKFKNFTPENQAEANPYNAPNHPGLLTRAGFLANGRWATEPITRGVFVQRRILCEDLPSPDFSVVNQRQDETASLDPIKIPNHQITHLKTNGAACITCHSKINPVGFALEGYDMLGMPRNVEQVFDFTKFYSPNKGIMATHQLPLPVANVLLGDKTVSVANAQDLANQVGASTTARQCLSRFVLRHFDRRRENSGDSCAVAEATNALQGDKPVLNAFVKTLANDDIFWRRK